MNESSSLTGNFVIYVRFITDFNKIDKFPKAKTILTTEQWLVDDDSFFSGSSNSDFIFSLSV